MDGGILPNLIVGIISGVISGVMVTQVYRQIDKKRDNYLYISELNKVVEKLFKCAQINTPEISNEYIADLMNFVTKTPFPQKRKWIRLAKEEKNVCKGFIDFYGLFCQKVQECYLNIQEIDKRETEFLNKVENEKLEIAAKKLEIIYYMQALDKLKRHYIR